MMPGKDKPDYETLLSRVWRKKVKLGKVWKHLGNVAPENTSHRRSQAFSSHCLIPSLSPNHGPALTLC